MTNPIEPTDVGPVVGGDRALTPTDRNQVISLLNAAVAEGRLEPLQRDQRILAARAAVDFDDLVPLTRDLVTSPITPAPITNPTPVVAPDGASSDQIVAIFSGVTRKRNWRVRPVTSILTLFGGVELDLTQASFDNQICDFNIFCLFGGVTLTVPVGTAVENDVLAIFGGSDLNKLGEPVSDLPQLRIKGFCGFGGVEVKNPKRRR